jgi:beta-lactamase class A
MASRMNRREFTKAILAFGGATLASPLLAVARANPSEGASEDLTGVASTYQAGFGLEDSIRRYILKARGDGFLASDEATSWSVYDFTSGSRLVAIKEDVPRECASMMKPFVALAFFHRYMDGRLTYDSRSRSLLEQMIQRSSNWATNEMIDLVGGPAAVDRILRGSYPSVFRQTRILEKIPPGGKTYMNQASANDYDRFLQAVWTSRLPHAGEIKRLMGLPNTSRLYHGVPNIPTGTLVYHKTGTTARLCGDFGILVPRDRQGRHYPYTLVAIIEKRSRTTNLTTWIERRAHVIRRVSGLVYDKIRMRHGLV